MKTKKDILRLIDEEDVEFIRLQFTDMFGNLKNLAVTPGQLERVLANKYVFDGSIMFAGLFNTESELYLHPDLDSFVILPWRPQQGKVGKFLCDVCNKDGSLFEMSSRTILKKVLEKSEKAGYTFYVDPECEFFLFETDDNGQPTTNTHEKAGYMDVGPADNGENARRDMVLTLEEMGFEVESSHHEKAPGQHQIAFKEGEPLMIADSLMTFKFAVRSIAKRFGLYATFMPKPITDVAGSGMHFHVSLYKDGKSIFHKDNNLEELSDEARWFMGGVIKHAQCLCAVTNPIVNSYKRILSGFEAPGDISWSEKSENTLLKVHKYADEDIKVEFRFPDPSANPYLALALCLAAGMDGIENKTNPGEAVTKENISDEREHLPENLKEAIILFENDSFVRDVLGDRFTEIYSESKMLEWNDYMKQVTDWEIEQYLYKM